MKITAKQYAKTLFELTDNKSQQEIDSCVLGFAQVVRKNRQVKLFPKILESFNVIWNSSKNIIEAEVTSKEKLDSESEKKIEMYLKEKYKAEKVLIDNRIDQKIIGGIIIRVGDEVMNQSISEQLKKLEKELTK